MNKYVRELFAGAVCVVFGSFVVVASATAEETPVTAKTIVDAKADTSCFLAPARLPPGDVEAFLANPSKLLVDEASAGLPLSNKVRSLAGSSNKAVTALIDIARTANDPQKAAIGAGLSRVVQACAGNPDYAANIQKLVAELADPALITAFMAASGDVQVAAVTGVPGAANNSVGGGATNDTTGQRNATNTLTFSEKAATETQSGNDFDIGDAGASATDFISGVTQ